MARSNSTSLGNWYAIAVSPNRERKIASNIADRLDKVGFTDKDVTLICPDQEVVVANASGDERQTTRKLTLPGYVLVHARRRLNANALSTMSRASGVVEFLGGNEHPTPLRPAEVEQMLGQTVNKRTLKARFEVGQLVAIKDGPMAGFSGTIRETNASTEMATVEVEIFGRATPVSTPYSAIGPA